MKAPTSNTAERKNKPLKVCIDKPRAIGNRFADLFYAFQAREKNVLNEDLRVKTGYDSLTEQTLLDAKATNDLERLIIAGPEVQEQLFELAMMKTTFWTNGQTLRVKFLGGDPFVQGKVMTYAKEWERFANITFDLVNDGDADIRVSFMPGGSWSYIGTDARSYPQNEPTMNFGWFDANTEEFEFARTVTHEFGHALGCVHEHQSPDAAIDWNKPAVYHYYMKPPNNWTKEQVDRNVFEKFDRSEITNSTYDPRSIMLYPIAKEFILSGAPVGMNTFLSQQDSVFIASVYPR